MSLIASQLQLTNLMAVRHSGPLPATYARGTKCLDYALASKTVCEALVRAGYESFDARLPSDHRGYFFDLQTDILFENPTQELATQLHHSLCASNVRQETKYINEKYELLLAHNAFERAERLMHLGDRHQFAERLDKVVLEASLVAESRIPHYAAPEWSTKLHNARHKVQWLCKVLSSLKTGIEHTHLPATSLPVQLDVPFPTSVKECSKQLRLAKQDVCNIVQQSYAYRDEERMERIRELEQSAASGDRHTARILRRFKKAEDIKQCSKSCNESE